MNKQDLAFVLGRMSKVMKAENAAAPALSSGETLESASGSAPALNREQKDAVRLHAVVGRYGANYERA